VSPPSWLYWPDATPAGPDWDTNEDGIFAFYWTSNANQPVANAFYQKEIISSSINYNDPAAGGDSSFRSHLPPPETTLRFYNSVGNAPPWIALWDTVNEVWHVGERTSGTSTDNYYTLSGTMPSSSTAPWEIMVMIYLPSDPGDISGWRAYDGTAPTLTVYP
jgi:hypothetical protein